MENTVDNVECHFVRWAAKPAAVSHLEDTEVPWEYYKYKVTDVLEQHDHQYSESHRMQSCGYGDSEQVLLCLLR